MEAARLQDGNLACNCRKFLGSKLESSENLSTFRTFLGICFSKVSIHRYPGIHFNFLSIYIIYIGLQLFAHGKGSEVLTLFCAIRSTRKFAANTPELFLHMSITSCFRRLCQTSAGSKSRCVQQSFVYNSQDAWIKESRWVKCLVLRSLFARRIDHIHLSPKEWSASAKLGISGRLRVPSFARNISNILLLEVIGTAIPTARCLKHCRWRTRQSSMPCILLQVWGPAKQWRLWHMVPMTKSCQVAWHIWLFGAPIFALLWEFSCFTWALQNLRVMVNFWSCWTCPTKRVPGWLICARI